MKPTRRQLIGIIMINAALVVAACIQWLGPGLIVTDYVALRQGTLAKDIIIVKRTRVHFLVRPLVYVGLIGFVCAVIPPRRKPRSSGAK